VTIPANRASHLLEEKFAGLSLQGVTGTIFLGQAARVVIQDQGLGSVNWSLRPWALLLGRLEYRIKVRDATLQGDGDVGLALGGVIFIDDLVAELQPDLLVNYFAPDAVKTTGQVSLVIDSLELSDGFPRELAGLVSWADARILEPVDLSLGQVEMVLSRVEEGVVGNLGNTSGATAVSGDLSLAPSGQYRINLLLTPGAATAPDIMELLTSFGQPKPGGAYLITDSGQL
jgi:general secretion pathway protein N